MQVAIYLCSSLAFVGGTVVTILLAYHKQTPAVWTTFTTVVLISLAFCLYWQDSIWNKQKVPIEKQSEKDQPEPPVKKSEEKKDLPQKTNGLTFKEVPASTFGIEIPDTFTVDFGNNTGTVLRSVLEKNIPLERITGISIGGEISIKIFFDKNDNFKVDTTIFDKRGNVAAIIKANDFSILQTRWDRNWDQTAFEIVDENGIPFFQIERPSHNNIRLRGIFRTSNGTVVIAGNEGLYFNPTTPIPAPATLFVYPSTNNLHKRVSP